jgi:hypothetical protein
MSKYYAPSYSSVIVQKPFRLPNNWFYLACCFTNPNMIARIQAVYRGYRVRQIVAQWMAARYFNPEVSIEHLRYYLRI